MCAIRIHLIESERPISSRREALLSSQGLSVCISSVCSCNMESVLALMFHIHPDPAHLF